MSRYLTPERAAEEMGISRATISRCKKMGAPVHYVGTCGRLYRINVEEFSAWMDSQGKQEGIKRKESPNVLELRAKRHAMCG